MQDLEDFAKRIGRWAAENEMLFEQRSSSERKELHFLAASLGLFTQSKGPQQARVLHVWRNKPVGWEPHSAKAAKAPKTTGAPQVPLASFSGYFDKYSPFKSLGGREFIGDCAECGCELYGYEEEEEEGEEGEEGEAEGRLCLRCGGDTLSKWEFMR